MSDPGDMSDKKSGTAGGVGGRSAGPGDAVSDAALDVLLAGLADAERRAAPAPSDALMARVLADAADVSARAAVAAEPAGEVAPAARERPWVWLHGLLDGPRAAALALSVVFALAMGIGYVDGVDGPGAATVSMPAEDADLATVLAALVVADASSALAF